MSLRGGPEDDEAISRTYALAIASSLLRGFLAKTSMEKRKKHIFIEIVGWYGTIAVLLAYGLNSFGLITVHTIWYLILNGTGALSIIINEGSEHDWAVVTLNLVWLLIAMVGIVRAFL